MTQILMSLLSAWRCQFLKCRAAGMSGWLVNEFGKCQWDGFAGSLRFPNAFKTWLSSASCEFVQARKREGKVVCAAGAAVTVAELQFEGQHGVCELWCSPWVPGMEGRKHHLKVAENRLSTLFCSSFIWGCFPCAVIAKQNQIKLAELVCKLCLVWSLWSLF